MNSTTSTKPVFTSPTKPIHKNRHLRSNSSSFHTPIISTLESKIQETNHLTESDTEFSSKGIEILPTIKERPSKIKLHKTTHRTLNSFRAKQHYSPSPKLKNKALTSRKRNSRSLTSRSFKKMLNMEEILKKQADEREDIVLAVNINMKKNIKNFKIKNIRKQALTELSDLKYRIKQKLDHDKPENSEFDVSFLKDAESTHKSFRKLNVNNINHLNGVKHKHKRTNSMTQSMTFTQGFVCSTISNLTQKKPYGLKTKHASSNNSEIFSKFYESRNQSKHSDQEKKLKIKSSKTGYMGIDSYTLNKITGLKEHRSSTRTTFNQYMKKSYLKIPENIELLESLKQYVPGCFSDQPTGRQETLMLKKWHEASSNILNKSERESSNLRQTEKELLTITVLEICRQVYVTCTEQGEMLLDCLTKFVQQMIDRKEKYFNLVDKNNDYLAKCKEEINLKYIGDMLDLEAKLVGLNKEMEVKDEKIKVLEKQVTTFNQVKTR